MRTNGTTRPRLTPAVSREEHEERRLVHKLVSGSRVPPDEVEDVVQEVMIAAARSAGRFLVPEGSTREGARAAWLRGIVARCVRFHRRVRGRRSRLDLRPDVPSGDWHGIAASPCAETLALARTSVVILNDGLALLREAAPAEHAVVLAYELEELPMDEVATLFGIRLNTAWNRLRRGRAVLRAHFQRAASQLVLLPVARGRSP